MLSGKKIYVAGHRGMVGSAICRELGSIGAEDVVFATSRELDLRRQEDTEAFVSDHKPEVIVIAAATVGGIYANDLFPADFAYDNLMIATNLIHAAHQQKVGRLLFLGSSCIYPKFAEQPIQEASILTGSLESTNEAYSIAKIAGLKLCEYYRKQYGAAFHSAMPCNLYGTGDNYHPENSHVIPALIRRFHEAKVSNASSVVIWGTGIVKREFLFADDLAKGLLHLLEMEDPPGLVNIGSGSDISIFELAESVAKTVGYHGRIETDPSKPDGTPRKLMDSSLMRSLSWNPVVSFEQGLALAYSDFLVQNEAVDI